MLLREDVVQRNQRKRCTGALIRGIQSRESHFAKNESELFLERTSRHVSAPSKGREEHVDGEGMVIGPLRMDFHALNLIGVPFFPWGGGWKEDISVVL